MITFIDFSQGCMLVNRSKFDLSFTNILVAVFCCLKLTVTSRVKFQIDLLITDWP
jgi:hypothetical protein